MQIPPPPDPDYISIVHIITWVLSILAFLLSGYTLYLQRKDKRPRLLVDAFRDEITCKPSADTGILFIENVPIYIVSIRNPTEKDITIDFINFRVAGHSFLMRPRKEIKSVSSFQREDIIIFEERLLGDCLRGQATGNIVGRFEVHDVLGNVFKSQDVELVVNEQRYDHSKRLTPYLKLEEAEFFLEVPQIKHRGKILRLQ